MARKPAADRKAEIVAACLDLADRLGPDRMTTTDVARAVGLTQPGVFRHFPTKQALWLAVAHDLAGRMRRSWDRALAGGGGPEERLRALVAVQFGQIEATPALPAVLYSRELNIDNPELRAVLQANLLAFQGHLVAVLGEMQDAGRLRRGLAPVDAAVFLISLIQGVAIRWSLGARTFALPEEGARLLEIQLSLMAREGADG